MNKKHFTLVELLVVVSIIAILAAMLLPALNRAVGKARAFDCVNRLKSLGQFMVLYTADYSDMLPYVQRPEGGDDYAREGRWSYLIAPYYGATEENGDERTRSLAKKGLICREHQKARGTSNSLMNYGINAVLSSDKKKSVMITQLKKVSQTSFIADASWSSSGYYNSTLYTTSLPECVHNGWKSCNVLFLDWHAREYRKTELPTFSSHVFWSGK